MSGGWRTAPPLAGSSVSSLPSVGAPIAGPFIGDDRPIRRASSGGWRAPFNNGENLGRGRIDAMSAHRLFPIHLCHLSGAAPRFLLHGRPTVTFENPPATALGRPPGPLFVRRV
ncbi:hypothetical protein HPP92_016530 [Vanilla planifolia]|uniref:Uncharacterized protein n=1 Tax=Vanilla planifolia TaxID=51239 RepID=A0A835QFU8_VANPL|nr:hypothetical protein HPP92_016530 [Vanilla planifolia]